MNEAGAPDCSVPLISRRHALIGGVLAASSALAMARQPTAYAPLVPKARFESWVPTRFQGWSVVGSSGVLLPPPDALSDRLYDDLVTRVYDSEREPQVMMLLAYNNLQDGVVQVHRPEVCYPVGGYALSPTEKVSLAVPGGSIPADFFTAVAPDRTEQVLYFTRLGDAYPLTWAEQRWAVVEANLRKRIPDGMMMRVSLLSNSRPEALATLSRFAATFIAVSPAPLRKLLVA
jgi:EpsI family protein